MSLALDPTIGGASANSFVTMAEADAYLEAVSAEWEDEDDDDLKIRKLIIVTRELSALGYQGYRATNTQALAWPRYNAPDPDGISGYAYFDTSAIPQRIKDATCELALEALRVDPVDIFALDAKISIAEKTVGPITTRYVEPSQRAQGLARYPRVWQAISPLLGIGSGQVRLVR